MEQLSEQARTIITSPNFSQKIQIFKRWWTIVDCSENPTHLFVFGDNLAKIGKGGQAIIRGMPNVVGIPTKKWPSFSAGSYFNDEEIEQNTKHIIDAIDHLIIISENYDKIQFPMDGLGTGLSDLPNRAPKTYERLVILIKTLFGIDYNSDQM
jgi:hypothetical protein